MTIAATGAAPSDGGGDATAAVRACVGLGANLGDATATLQAACAALARLPATRWVARSQRYRSAPVDAAGPDFTNAVALIETRLAPLELLDALQAIEQGHGRERPYRNAPRTLDLDLLFHGEQLLASDRLTLPHPRWLARAFVLLPLLELCPASTLVRRPGAAPDLARAGLATAAQLLDHARALAARQGIELLAAPWPVDLLPH